MPDGSRPTTIADLPPQRAAAPSGPAEARGRFFNTGNGFNVINPIVPDRLFTEEPLRALDPATPTGLIACDISADLGCDFPATSPLVLAHYARVRAGESLTTDFRASGAIAYVMIGEGETSCGGETIHWGAGDVIALPGGVGATHRAAAAGPAVLWVVTNEPQLAFENLRAPGPGESPTELVHFRGEEIDRQIALLNSFPRRAGEAGSALIFSSEARQETRNILPTLTAALNFLPAGVDQPSHRHNSVAVSLVIRGKDCFSIIDGKRKDWAPWATTITPPVSVHSHHNGGDEEARFLIIQDGGIYYHTRAMGFEFCAHPGQENQA